MRLIDANELKKKFGYTDEWYKSRTVAQIIDNAPTVDTTFREVVAYECGKNDRPKGKWIEYDEDELYTGECSCCKWKALLYESNVLNMNFCPNCGADMRGDV